MSKRLFVIPDLQVPYEDRKFVAAMAQCIADNKSGKDEVLTIGDEMDMQTISRWSAGTAKEWEFSIAKDRDRTVQVLKDLQVDHVIRSNHTDRLFNKVMMGAPGLLGLPELELENFLKLKEVGAKFHKQGYRITQNWWALHGDEAGLSQIAGTTAAKLAVKTGTSVICGHTHRLGYQPVTHSVNGFVTRTVHAIEVGHAMDIKKALYAKTHNWQQGWVVLYIDKGKVTPSIMPVVNKSFIFEGKEYKW